MDKNSNQEGTQVNFVKKVFPFDGQPFELLLNHELLYEENRFGFTWAWRIVLQRFDIESAEEKEKLHSLMIQIIQKIMGVANIQIVGTTLFKNNYDIMFYAKAEDTAVVGGTISEMPYSLEDRKGRFMNYTGENDVKWEKVNDYYNLVLNKWLRFVAVFCLLQGENK